VEIAHGVGRTVGGEQHVLATVLRRGGRDEMQLDRPVGELRGLAATVVAIGRRRSGHCAEVHGARAGTAGVGVERDGFGLGHGFVFLLKRVCETVFFEKGNGLGKILVFAVFAQVDEVGADDAGTLADDVGHDLPFVVGCGFAFLDGDRALRAMAEARAQTVATEVADEPSLAVNELDGALWAGGNAVTTAVALLSVYLDDLPFHAVNLALVAVGCIDARQQRTLKRKADGRSPQPARLRGQDCEIWYGLRPGIRH